MASPTPTVDFKDDVLESEVPVVALFHARWCGFCSSFLPTFRGVRADGFRLVEVDISDYDSPLWDTYGIEIVPTLIAFDQGVVIDRVDGRFMSGLSEDDLERIVEAVQKR